MDCFVLSLFISALSWLFECNIIYDIIKRQNWHRLPWMMSKHAFFILWFLLMLWIYPIPHVKHMFYMICCVLAFKWSCWFFCPNIYLLISTLNCRLIQMRNMINDVYAQNTCSKSLVVKCHNFNITKACWNDWFFRTCDIYHVLFAKKPG